MDNGIGFQSSQKVTYKYNLPFIPKTRICWVFFVWEKEVCLACKWIINTASNQPSNCTTLQVPLLVVHSQLSGHFRSLGVTLHYFELNSIHIALFSESNFCYATMTAGLFLAISKTGMCLLTSSCFKRFTVFWFPAG